MAHPEESAGTGDGEKKFIRKMLTIFAFSLKSHNLSPMFVKQKKQYFWFGKVSFS
jgi:hypothetical protein